MTKQTTIEACLRTPIDNISVPIGVVLTVRTVMRYLGLYDYLDAYKQRGFPLSKVVESLCIMHLSGESSVFGWSKHCSITDSMAEAMTYGEKIGRKAYEDALERLDTYAEDIIEYLNSLLWTIYPDINTDAYADGSHIPRAGGAGKNVRYGPGGGKIQLQDQFMVAQLIDSSLPIMVELYPGNENDPQQFGDFIPQLMFILKKGSTIVMDHGGSSDKLLKEIKNQGYEYITRVGLNSSDLNIIKTRIQEAVYVGNGTACIKTSFDSSGRTNYLFFSVDTLIAEMISNEREVKKMKAELDLAKKTIKTKKPDNLIKVRKNRYIEVEIKQCVYKITLDPFLDIDFEKESQDKIAEYGGWFKLTSSRDLNPKVVLMLYRHRVAVEHLIHSLKSIVHMKPLRMWNEQHERGALILGLIAQLILSLVRYEMEPEIVEKMSDRKLVEVSVKPSLDSICYDLQKYTLTVSYNKGRTNCIYSNAFGSVPKVLKVLAKFERNGPVTVGEEVRAYVA